MKVHTGSLELAQPKSEEVVQLTENSATLELLFQFCYPERHPDLNGLAFDTLAELAEAAEKYKVFSAISLCKIGMRCVFRGIRLCNSSILLMMDLGLHFP